MFGTCLWFISSRKWPCSRWAQCSFSCRTGGRRSASLLYCSLLRRCLLNSTSLLRRRGPLYRHSLLRRSSLLCCNLLRCGRYFGCGLLDGRRLLGNYCLLSRGSLLCRRWLLDGYLLCRRGDLFCRCGLFGGCTLLSHRFFRRSGLLRSCHDNLLVQVARRAKQVSGLAIHLDALRARTALRSPW